MLKILLPIHIDRWRSPIATLLRSCVEFNPDIHFFSFSKPLSDEDHEKSIEFWNLPNVTKANRLTSLLHRFDIVHIASHTKNNLAAGTFAKIRGIKHTRFLYTVNLEFKPETNKNFMHRWFNVVVDDYASVSKAASIYINKHTPSRFRGVIANGYDDGYFDPKLEVAEDLPAQVKSLNGKPYILNVASLELRKHPEWILKLAERNPDLNFVMAGWVLPGLGEPYLEEIRSANLPNLTWMGHVNRSTIRALLRYASAFAFPSEREGLPLSVIEAMGMGVPVVAQPKSSLPELIVDSGCGSLIDIDDSDALVSWSDTLRKYVSMKVEERATFQSDLSTRTKQQYSWESIGKAYSKLYHQIISSKCE